MTDKRTDPGEIARQLRLAVDGSVGLPMGDIESILLLLGAGEWALALDVLCTQIDEYELDVSEAQRSLLTGLGNDLGVRVEDLLGEP